MVLGSEGQGAPFKTYKTMNKIFKSNSSFSLLIQLRDLSGRSAKPEFFSFTNLKIIRKNVERG